MLRGSLITTCAGSRRSSSRALLHRRGSSSSGSRSGRLLGLLGFAFCHSFNAQQFIAQVAQLFLGGLMLFSMLQQLVQDGMASMLPILRTIGIVNIHKQLPFFVRIQELHVAFVGILANSKLASRLFLFSFGRLGRCFASRLYLFGRLGRCLGSRLLELLGLVFRPATSSTEPSLALPHFFQVAGRSCLGFCRLRCFNWLRYIWYFSFRIIDKFFKGRKFPDLLRIVFTIFRWRRWGSGDCPGQQLQEIVHLTFFHIGSHFLVAMLFLLGTPLNGAQVAQHDIALLANKAHKICKFWVSRLDLDSFLT